MKKILLLVAIVCAARMVQAQGIIYGYFDPVAEYPLAAQWSLDFNGDGVNELQINSTTYDLGLDWTSTYFTLSGTAQSLTPIYQGLSAGTVIGPDAGAWGNLTGSEIFSSEYNGQNDTSETSFALLSAAPYLPIAFEKSDGLHYGWVRFETNGLFGFEDWAYETAPNTPIAAGAVPEPSTWTLLAAGAATLLLRRKFRSARQFN
jgi:hypothetical protein